ncbi:MAG: COG1361 S-layer family protein [Methanophagales archaeon]|nr:COG1361 S-layer family protein [Methanophagales archaeon]
MLKKLLFSSTMRKTIALFSIVAILVCIVPSSSAGTDAKIVITGVKPTELSPGDTKEITLTVKNAGSNDAKQVTFNFQESQYISVVGSSSVCINSINGWCSKDMVITVHVSEGAPGGTYSIPVTCTFSQYDSSGSQGSVTESMPEVSYSIVFRVVGGAIIDVSDVDMAELNPGEETKLKFTITNIGNSPLQNLVFSWNEGEGVILPVYSDNTKYIEYIDAGESIELEYTVVADVNAEAGLYQLYLSCEFEDGNGDSGEILNTTTGVFVGGETDFDVTFSESSAGQTSLSVANTGNNPALSVTVRIPQQENFEVRGSTASIVGNLDEGDYTIVSFQVTPASSSFGGTGAASQQRNAAQDNNLKVLIEYTDATGVRRTVEKTVLIQFMDISSDGSQLNTGMGQQESIWQNPTLIVTIAILGLIIGGFIYYKKRKSVILRKKKE